MKPRAALSLVLLLVTTGCASRTDWIESTLVTVDVTGVWRGQAGDFPLTLFLEQRGAKVTGRIEPIGGRGGDSIQGSVEGDVFRFEQSFGKISGEATVAGDEMMGQVQGVGGVPVPFSRLSLRRDASAVPGDRKKP